MGGALPPLPLYAFLARKRKTLPFFNYHFHPAVDDHMLVATCFGIKVSNPLTCIYECVGDGLAHFVSWDLIYLSVLSAHASCLTGLGFEPSIGHRMWATQSFSYFPRCVGESHSVFLNRPLQT
jgi:hypothetical protein